MCHSFMHLLNGDYCTSGLLVLLCQRVWTVPVAQRLWLVCLFVYEPINKPSTGSPQPVEGNPSGHNFFDRVTEHAHNGKP